MKFTVVGKPNAVDALASIWMAATDRKAVTDAANRIDHLLGTLPSDVGESRVANIRFLNESPLAIYYDVFEDDRRVAVWAVWQVVRER